MTLAHTEAMESETMHYKEWLEAGMEKGCKELYTHGMQGGGRQAAKRGETPYRP